MTAQETCYLDLDDLTVDNAHPTRRAPTEAERDAMTRALATDGLAQPLIAVRNDEGVTVVDGRRRLASLRALDAADALALPDGTTRDAIPVRVLDPATAQREAAVANMAQRPSGACECIRTIQELISTAAYKDFVVRPDELKDGRPTNPRNVPGITAAIRKAFGVSTERARTWRRLAEDLPAEALTQMMGTRRDGYAALDRVRRAVRQGMDSETAVAAELADDLDADGQAAERGAPAFAPEEVAADLSRTDDENFKHWGAEFGRQFHRAWREKLARAIMTGGARNAPRTGERATWADTLRASRRLRFAKWLPWIQLRNRDIAALAQLGEASVNEVLNLNNRHCKIQDTLDRVDRALDRLSVPADPPDPASHRHAAGGPQRVARPEPTQLEPVLRPWMMTEVAQEARAEQ